MKEIEVNVCLTEKEQKKLENELERIDEKIIELTEAHNAIKGNKKILIGTYSLYPLRIYELSEYTRKTGKRYSRKKYWKINSWLFSHTVEVISFYD